MTSSNGNIFRVTGHLCGEFTGPPVNSPHKGHWRGALMFTLICARINGWVNNSEAGDLRRYRAHYDVIVMCSWKKLVWKWTRISVSVPFFTSIRLTLCWIPTVFCPLIIWLDPDPWTFKHIYHVLPSPLTYKFYQCLISDSALGPIVYAVWLHFSR